MRFLRVYVFILPQVASNNHRDFQLGNSTQFFSEYEIVYDDNSSQELDDDDVEHLIEEGQNEIEEESDQVYSS